MKFRKGDQVKIISGNDKGRSGKIIAVFPHTEKIVVEGVNVRKKHVRPKRQGQKGEMVQFPAPFPGSRALLICSSCKMMTRVGYRIDGRKKMRACKKCASLT